MNYETFLNQKKFDDPNAGFEPGSLNPNLFDFQREIVRWACIKGRSAIFADTGLGKTLMQTAWADAVVSYCGEKVLIAAPLCVAHQTVDEAERFGIIVEYCRNQRQADESGVSIIITNYEMLNRFDPKTFAGIVLDESSILKSKDGKTRALITDMFCRTPYRLSCTATPSPNDYMEIGNQAEFLGVMKSVEMLAMFFTHDGGDVSKWRLKGHGKTKFWEWMASWAVCIKSPADLGFDGSAYILKPMHIHEHMVECDFVPDGQLFPMAAETLAERRQAKRASMDLRIDVVRKLVMEMPGEPWMVWCHLNDEQDLLEDVLGDLAYSVRGSMALEAKENAVHGWINGERPVMISKPSIFGYGLNFQFCRNMVFAGLDDSYELFYQAVRRCYRFGQKREVNVHIVGSNAEGNIRANIQRKQKQADLMAESMVGHMAEFTKLEITGTLMEKSEYSRDLFKNNNAEIHLCDCVDLASDILENSIDFTVFSPPFEGLYVYSNSDRDMGNSKDSEEFSKHFSYLVKELFRITKPGRNVSFHCANMPMTKFRDGEIGIRDFRGDLIRMFVDAGFIYHSEVCIWKDPVTAMQRTKALGLLHKQTLKDTAMSRQGIPDYLVTMRKPGKPSNPVTKTRENFPVEKWQRYASPVWMDVNPSRTLQYMSARESDDERHICPLQLDVIERAIELWSNPGDFVFSPFTGIGSEGFCAIQMGRRFIGSELKRSYWELAVRNIKTAKARQGYLFDMDFV